ncbi:MAG: phenylalanyl-tRNA synthetase beta chain [Polyangiales bacterium]|jgi:phenylalanyl-tRNA synthetase beta chain
MLASYRWLKELSGVDASPEQMAEKLTDAGLEVESLTVFPVAEGVVVAEVTALRPHPTKDKLRLVTVDHGEGTQEVVCGAPNVPEVGGKVLLAKLGAVLPPQQEGGEPFVIAERAVAGVPSAGMLCSEKELSLGEGGEGIYVFPGQGPTPGTLLADALPAGDTVFEIGLTPNRPDCLGHIGIARDLAAMFKVTMPEPNVGSPPTFAEGISGVIGTKDIIRLQWTGGREVTIDSAPDGALAIDIKDTSRCPRYGAAAVIGVRVGPSPFWLRYRLHCLGVRSISNLVDATNLVMLEWGHPIHGFDYDKLRGTRIEVRTAHAGETIETLDGVERKLNEDDLLICDGEGPVAIAGVMGSANSEIDDTTTNVAIECAYFDPRSVRRTSRRLGLHTDASHRFERGVDPNAVSAVLARAAAVIAEVGGGIALAEAIDIYPSKLEGPVVELRHSALESLLGVTVPKDEPARVLRALGANVEAIEGGVQAKVPTWRPDLGREADLIEEVARVWGYEHIVPTVPKVRASRTGTPARLLFERALRDAVTGAGLHEAITYAFVSPDDLAKSGAAPAEVKLDNPLSEAHSVMRTSLLPGLAAAAVHALRRQAPQVRLFEVGRSFHKGDDLLPKEVTRLAFLLAGSAQDGFNHRDVDFYDLKGAIEDSLSDLGSVRFEFASEAPVHLHPRRSAQVFIGETLLGFAGELHPDVADALEFGGRRATYAELSVEALDSVRAARGTPVAPAIPRFPFVSRDVALLLDQERPAAHVAETLRTTSTLIESVELFDVFEGDTLPDGKRSLAFHILYRDPEGTLTDKKVDKEHSKLVKAAVKELQAELR